MNNRTAIGSLALLIGVSLSWLLMSVPPSENEPASPDKKRKNEVSFGGGDSKSKRKPGQAPKRREFDPNAIPHERVIVFKSEEAYRDFLAKLGKNGVRNLGTIDQLRAVRIGFDSLADLDALELDPDETDYNYPVTIPENREIAPQDGIVGFGGNALSFLGINTDNSQWGSGVTIAVIDTGISPHLALSNNIQHINLVDLPDGVAPHSHGTSVASLIAGNHPGLMGVAPAADLISVRVANETGSSTSFILAEGIIAATDAGAQLINISMGADGESLVVRQAIDYATENGAVIFASSGNEGATQASSPASNPNVFSVGAVDANGTHLNFSSADPDLAFTAPGYEVTAAYTGDNATSFTGTSAAVAFPVGAVAAIMSESDIPLSAQQAVTILQNTSNEAGLPGQDPNFGIGVLDVGRAMNRDTPGITDLAVASHNYLLSTPQDSTSGLQVSIENRGTEPVFGATVDINIGGDRFPYTVQSLQPNERTVVTIPAGQTQLLSEGSLEVSSSISLPGGSLDSQPANDRRREVIRVESPQGNGP